jgi:hypothetical protein
MVNGSSAEQPNPAMPNARIPSAGSSSGRSAIATNATASTIGNSRYVRRVGSQRWIAAKSTRPIVTEPQKAVSAREAIVVDAPSAFISSVAQLPFIVSQIP